MHLFTLTGRVVKQAEVRTASNGAHAISFRVAVNTSYKDKASGERKQDTTYYNAVMWKEAGQSTKLAESLTTGTVVELYGLPKANPYLDKDQKPQASIEVRVSRLELHGGGHKEGTPAQEIPEPVVFTANSGLDDDNDLPF